MNESGMMSRYGLGGMDHVGVTVHDLAQTIAFYEDLFGVKSLHIGEVEGEFIGKIVGKAKARVKFAYFPVGKTVVEFVEYVNPQGKPYGLNDSDVGSIHLSIAVDDVKLACGKLRDRGIEFLHDAIIFDERHGELKEYGWARFRDPNGIQVELFEHPISEPTT